ncbi:nucleotide pyrophosphohydrolase [Gammaproteobacteria bacterium AB-CW1]|uniref:Nucleotide pyrophosphohydrolase n=1 Tax=Natronospira elongata TaxID=3110268 RepID=A0AAP6JH21_9GAMM|nr:nucleotide pyrophosphohydrolase [Gammaproteobacteria bacterium AB-CW1]
MEVDANFMPEIRERLASFVHERDWSQFHTPKNLVMALSGEVGELSEHFQWLSNEDSDALDLNAANQVRREVADVQIYLLLLADRLGIDLASAVTEKIDENELKYPVERSRGRSKKYTDI